MVFDSHVSIEVQLVPMVFVACFRAASNFAHISMFFHNSFCAFLFKYIKIQFIDAPDLIYSRR